MIADFIALVQATREYAKRRHWATDSYAQHMALDRFYNESADSVDRLVECYPGRYDVITDIPYMACENSTGPIELLEQHLKMLEAMRYQAIPKEDSTLQNLVDEIIAHYLNTLFLLRRLR